MPEPLRSSFRAEEPAARFQLRRADAPAAVPTFADDVRRGLTASPKFLLPRYFYDDMGSLLFAAICLLPEYYLTRVETSILGAHAGEVVATLPSPLRLIELGSGESQKTRLVIEAILARQGRLEYVPVDISETALVRAGEQLVRDYPELVVEALAGEYAPGLQRLAAERGRRGAAADLVLFLGSTLGNLDPAEQGELFASVRRILAPGDGFLVGVDWKKPAAELVPAYDDALGVTAAFNLNLLLRINRELGADFDLASFRHLARYDEERSRIEMHLASRRAQRVTVRALDLEVSFDEGETIHTESSYRFDAEDLARLAAASDFALRRTWFDDRKRFASALFVAV